MSDKLENEIKLHRQISSVMKDMPDFVNQWCLHLQATNKTLLSCYGYIRKIRNFLEYISDDIKNVTIRDITAEACESYLISCQTRKDKNGMECFTCYSSQKTTWSILNNFTDFLFTNRYIDYNYMQNIERTKKSDLERINETRILLTQRDFNKILKASQTISGDPSGLLDNRNPLIILLFLTTGIKKSAIMEIDLDDINMENKTLSVTDNKNRTTVYDLSERTIDYLNKWLDDRKQLATENSGKALFLTKNGYRLGDDTIYNIVKESCKKGVGKKLSPTELRTGFCSILYQQTHNIEFVQRVIGHDDVRTTQRYFQGKDERKQAVKIISDKLKI